jgi:hypothetical protein
VLVAGFPRATRQARCYVGGVRSAVFILILASLIVPGCGSTTTELAAPTIAKCGVSATLSSAAFPSAGGSAALAVTSARECSWTVTTDAAWMVPDQRSGQGDATLSVKVAPNASPSSRRGAVVVEGTRLDLTQEGAPCRFQLNATRLEVPGEGGPAQVTVTTIDGCAWTARSDESWITIREGAAGTRTEVVQLVVAPNSGARREGALTIAAQRVVVAQQAVPAATPPPAPTPGPAPPAPPPSGPGPTPRPNPAPTPQPTPTPNPAPTPNPTPPVPEAAEVEGAVSTVSGGCPAITFTVAGTRVTAGESTDYRRGNCKHVVDGARVLVVGERQDNRSIRAMRIDILNRED